MTFHNLSSPDLPTYSQATTDVFSVTDDYLTSSKIGNKWNMFSDFFYSAQLF